MNACITRETFVFYSFSASVSFDFETPIMSTCMSTSRSNYFDMSIWKKHADHTTTLYALRPGRHVGFFWNNKICFNFVSILFEEIKLTVSERTYIIAPMVYLGFMKFKQQWVRPYFVRSSMAAVSSVTWQILLQWRHVKTLYLWNCNIKHNYTLELGVIVKFTSWFF